MNNGSPDFDFLHGSWQVQHRRLRERLAGCQDWADFTGTCRAQSWLGGAANVDDNWLDLPDGAYHAASIRTFDRAKQQWSIWWLDGRNPGEMDPPVVGRFTDGTGEFYAEMIFKDRLTRVRFLWTQTRTSRPRWEQAFSVDGGQTWETNWTMDFIRPTE